MVVQIAGERYLNMCTDGKDESPTYFNAKNLQSKLMSKVNLDIINMGGYWIALKDTVYIR